MFRFFIYSVWSAVRAMFSSCFRFVFRKKLIMNPEDQPPEPSTSAESSEDMRKRKLNKSSPPLAVSLIPKQSRRGTGEPTYEVSQVFPRDCLYSLPYDMWRHICKQFLLEDALVAARANGTMGRILVETKKKIPVKLCQIRDPTDHFTMTSINYITIDYTHKDGHVVKERCQKRFMTATNPPSETLTKVVDDKTTEVRFYGDDEQINEHAHVSLQLVEAERVEVKVNRHRLPPSPLPHSAPPHTLKIMWSDLYVFDKILSSWFAFLPPTHCLIISMYLFRDWKFEGNPPRTCSVNDTQRIACESLLRLVQKPELGKVKELVFDFAEWNPNCFMDICDERVPGFEKMVVVEGPSRLVHRCTPYTPLLTAHLIGVKIEDWYENGSTEDMSLEFHTKQYDDDYLGKTARAVLERMMSYHQAVAPLTTRVHELRYQYSSSFNRTVLIDKRVPNRYILVDFYNQEGVEQERQVIKLSNRARRADRKQIEVVLESMGLKADDVEEDEEEEETPPPPQPRQNLYVGPNPLWALGLGPPGAPGNPAAFRPFRNVAHRGHRGGRGQGLYEDIANHDNQNQ